MALRRLAPSLCDTVRARVRSPTRGPAAVIAFAFPISLYQCFAAFSTGPWFSGSMGFCKAMAMAISDRLTFLAPRAFHSSLRPRCCRFAFGLSGPQLCRPVPVAFPRLQMHRNTSAAGSSSSRDVAAPADSPQARALQSLPPTRPVVGRTAPVLLLQ